MITRNIITHVETASAAARWLVQVGARIERIGITPNAYPVISIEKPSASIRRTIVGGVPVEIRHDCVVMESYHHDCIIRWVAHR